MKTEPEPADKAGTAAGAGHGRALADDDAAVLTLRSGGSIAIIFLLAYLAYDAPRADGGGISAAAAYHWMTIALTLLFFAGAWTPLFRRHWRLWALAYCDALIVILILISLHTRDPDSRFIAVLLCPLAAVSFVNWGWRWQGVMNLTCVALYALGEWLVPLPGAQSGHRWLGVLAAVTVAQCGAVFIDRHRAHLRAQLESLTRAAALRESLMAAMAHDIRSPLGALLGFAGLLEDTRFGEDERRAVLERIGATVWTMDLTVSNLLDLYQTLDGRIACRPVLLDPDRVIAETAADCAARASRAGIKLVVDCRGLSRRRLDPRHLERLVQNLLAYSISRLTSGEVRLRSYPRGDAMVVEVEDDGPAPGAKELAEAFAGPGAGGLPPRSGALGLYIARAFCESTGGAVEAQPSERGGVRLVAVLRPAGQEPNPCRP